MTTAPFDVGKAEAADIPALAAIHAEALPDDFLPSLGERFLREVYYPAALMSPHAQTLVARHKGQAAGFVTVAHDTAAFLPSVIGGRRGEIALEVAKAALRSVTVVRHSVEIALSIATARPDPINGEIVLIAVAPTWQGKGAGRLLIQAALDGLTAAGVPQCRTKTLASNADVIRLYERMGWSIRDRFTLIGRRYVTLVSPVLG